MYIKKGLFRQASLWPRWPKSLCLFEMGTLRNSTPVPAKESAVSKPQMGGIGLKLKSSNNGVDGLSATRKHVAIKKKFVI